jgi:hypothetical protein
VESGPAAGAIGAAALGEMLGEANIIAFDMGGTTAKACLIEGGEPRLTDEMEVGAGINIGQRLLGGGGYLVRSPTIDLAEIGAGGGSLAWIDKGGALRVGPDSAGADPGPACYGRGGTRPTVTDANVVLGFLNPLHLLDGDMPIDKRCAEDAIRVHVAEPLNLSVQEAAYGIHSIANGAMTRAIQAVSSEIGRSPREFAMVAFGGNGAVHGATLAAAAGISDIIIPPASGVFSALGLTAPISVKSLGAAPSNHSWATNAIIEYIYPATPFTIPGTVPVTWYDGRKRPPADVVSLLGKVGLPDQGSIIIGTQGVMVVPHVGRPILLPAQKYDGFKYPDVGSANHWHEFIDAVGGTGKTSAGFDYSGPLTESVLLGSVATRFPNQLLEWTSAKLKFTNVAEANQHVRRAYRTGWETKGL